MTPLWDRFWDKVDAEGDCWEWTAAKSNGYGKINSGGVISTTLRAHRVSWYFLVGEIPDGLELDHLCRNRGCVNPDHLEPVTRKENMRRGHWAADVQRAKTECPHGHEYTPDNTYIIPSTGSRSCVTCKKNRDQARTSNYGGIK